MTWFRRGRDPLETPPPGSAPHDSSGDSPDELRAELWKLIRFINANSGKLPTSVVVAARHVTDTVREVIDTSDVRPLDVYAVVSVKATLGDYLPTSLRAYLALDPALVTLARPDGSTPTDSLLAQIDDLQRSANATLEAARNQDVDALISQGNFLRTKFSGSDLDL